MPFLNAMAAVLAWLGRQGTRALAAMIFIGIAAPVFGTLLKPFVPQAVFVLLILAFLRVDPAAVRAHLRRPGLIIAISLWTMLALPALLLGAYALIGLPLRSPGLFLALALQAVASPMMSSPAIAALLGLDAALVLTAMIACSALIPLTAPVFARIFLGDTLTLSPLALGTTLFGMLAGAGLLAALLRRAAGEERIARWKDEIDGINVIVLFIFVAALMGDIAVRSYAEPLLVISYILIAFALALALLGLTTLVFARAGWRNAFALGLLACQRNMGLMLAATGGAVPELTWLYFALAQFPIYLMPQMLQPLARRLRQIEPVK